jgi:hypothetical protein
MAAENFFGRSNHRLLDGYPDYLNLALWNFENQFIITGMSIIDATSSGKSAMARANMSAPEPWS